MDSSRYVQLSADILVEYIYTDQANPATFNTATYPIEIMRDGHTGGSYLWNGANVSSTMGNFRDRTAAAINTDKTNWVSLNSSFGVPYNDYDPQLTSTVQLPQSFSPELDIEYDTVRVYFTSGFSFNDFDGIIFEILANRRDNKELNLASVNYLRTDTVELLAEPFLLASKLYSTYIEFKVPAVYYMNNSFLPTDPNSLGFKLTSGQGFEGTPYITVRASGISETTVDNSYNFYDVETINSVSILNRDIYDNLYAQVIESPNGDYFELSGEVSGSTFESFISTLESQTGANYVVFHDIVVTEQVGTNFAQTSNQVFTQDQNFDTSILLRPIILNSANAISFIIDYTLRIYNTSDNSQIIKKSRLSSFDVKKYGRRLMKINLGTVPTVARVYNQLQPDDGSRIVINDGTSLPGQGSDMQAEQLVVRTRYITGFRDRINVKAAIAPAKVQTITETDDE
tara:strand:+ start:746 stop:2113 length:1368 start_codon:yes stop_codon:yes gene_type:complete